MQVTPAAKRAFNLLMAESIKSEINESAPMYCRFTKKRQWWTKKAIRAADMIARLMKDVDDLEKVLEESRDMNAELYDVLSTIHVLVEEDGSVKLTPQMQRKLDKVCIG